MLWTVDDETTSRLADLHQFVQFLFDVLRAAPGQGFLDSYEPMKCNAPDIFLFEFG